MGMNGSRYLHPRDPEKIKNKDHENAFVFGFSVPL
jgi:hypothetical protein